MLNLNNTSDKMSRSSTVIRNAHRVLKTINSNKDLRLSKGISAKLLDPYRDNSGPRAATSGAALGGG